MADALGKEIEMFLQRAEALRATPVIKLFMIPTAELRRTRCEVCGRSVQVNLRGTSRPVCWHRDCLANERFKGEPTTLYHVFSRRPRAAKQASAPQESEV